MAEHVQGSPHAPEPHPGGFRNSPLDAMVTGHAGTDALVPIAKRLLAALHKDDGLALSTAFRAAADVVAATLPDGTPGAAFLGAAGLALVLAAAVDPDHDFAESVGWVRDKRTYQHARESGLSHYEAVGWTLHVLDGVDARVVQTEAAARVDVDDQHAAPPGPKPERRLHLVRTPAR